MERIAPDGTDSTYFPWAGQQFDGFSVFPIGGISIDGSDNLYYGFLFTTLHIWGVIGVANLSTNEGFGRVSAGPYGDPGGHLAYSAFGPVPVLNLNTGVIAIATQPMSQTITNGTQVTFSVAVSSQSPLGYQWLKNGTNLTDVGNIVGSSTSTLTLTTTTLADSGNYRVIVTNALGSLTSMEATLTVVAAPSITMPPQSETVLAGSNVVLVVAVTAYPPPNYQWTFNGANLTGATGASLLLTNAQFVQSGSYSVAVTNSIGYAISTPATLTVLAPPQILSQPVSQIGYWGLAVSFQVNAIGTLPLSYQWYFDSFPITWATNATLALPDLDLDSGGQYVVEVTNPYGSAISETANLTVNPAGISLGLYPGLSIIGAIGKSFGIQYVTNVGATNSWTTITNITLTQPVQLWLDTSVNVSDGSQPRRLYRVVAIP